MKALAIALTLTTLFACAKSENSPASNPPDQNQQERSTPTPTPAPTPAPTPTPQPLTWSRITERTQCEALNPLFCKGLWGFSVDPSGTYKIGPNGSGQILTGRVTAKELSDLSTQIQPVAAYSALSSCEPADRLPGSSDLVSLVMSARLTFAVYDWQGAFGKTCYRGHVADAKALHETLNTIMLNHYPPQF